jgi:serine/threonine-protein kinase
VGQPAEAAHPRFEILREIARGGGGTVFKATDRVTGDEVALKVFDKDGPPDGRRLGRFNRERGTLAGIDHPNIVKIRDHGVYRGRPYLVMEFIRGASLARVLRRGPLPERTSLVILQKLALTIEHLHSLHIIHRDLKPGNIMVKKGGDVVIVDFGLMKSYFDDDLLQKKGHTLGTPAYMAPELVEGDLHNTDERTDIFSLGAVLYEMLTGVRAFPAKEPERIFRQILRMRPAPPREIRPAISEDAETVCLRCMEKSPKDRYESATRLANAVGRILFTGHL